ncbi:MAG: putative glycoside hydrolase [Patescibacteria group bacterium]|nr:putative glycoside hydrolase [Patescibacteria group bacterium]MCL5261779.1 putative glycoside hydrolase [Patescibacteria group bacterium]
MKKILFIIILGALITGAFLFLNTTYTFRIGAAAANEPEKTNGLSGIIGKLINIGEDQQATAEIPISQKNGDIENQKPLAEKPTVVKAIYSTAWSAGSTKQVDYFINLVKTTELNAVVVDIKDYSGYVAYDIEDPLINQYKAKDVKIPKINALIKKFHDQGIYVIGRIAVFQDPILAKNRPDLAVQSKSNGKTWLDRKGLAWMDPASQEVWDYNLGIAKDATSRGFDEINFDYIRFPSDGNITDMNFPVYDMVTPKHLTMRKFFQYVRNTLPETTISADLFGLAAVVNDDLGIGQIIEDALPYFDAVCPMAYPSHYATNFLGFKNPADHPYEVVKDTIQTAMTKLHNLESQGMTNQPKIRLWLQDFDMGATYDAVKVRQEITAVEEIDATAGWMLWSPENSYTKAALLPATE